MKLILLSCAWVAGIFLGSKIDLHPALIIAGLCPVPFILFFRQVWKPLLLLSACLIVFSGAAFYYPFSLPDNSLTDLHEQGIVEIIGTVSTQPETGESLTRVELSISEVDGKVAGGKILLFVPRYPEYNYGDILLVTGELQNPPQFEGFDYQAYLAREGVFSVMLTPKVDILGYGAGSSWLEWIHKLRERLSESLAASLPEPQASLAQGIVLGIRTTIPDDLKSDLSITGSAHLLAISGINLTIIAGILVSLGIWLFGRRYYIYVWMSLIMVWFYALITGMQAPVFRAAIMASLFLFAELLGRQKNVFPALMLSAAVMVGLNPQLLWSVSFQLSFLAMVGLVFISPVLRNWVVKHFMSRMREDSFGTRTLTAITDSFSTTLGAIIAIWPVIAVNFGLFSFVGPLSTLLIAPALPFIITTGSITAFTGIFSLHLANVIGWITWLPITYMILMVRGFAALPAAFIHIGRLHYTLVWAYYSLMAVAIFIQLNFKKFARLLPGILSNLRTGASRSITFLASAPKTFVFVPLLLIAFLVSFTAVSLPDDNLHVSFLDIGEGDSILVQIAGKSILIDGGPSPQAVCLALSEKLPFWDHSIDMVILTHPHLDHLSGLVEVLKRYRVKQVLAPGITTSSPVYQEWIRLIRTRNIEYTLVKTGQQVSIGDRVVLEVLNSPELILEDSESAMENEGLVIRLAMDDISFLITGDIQQKAELDLVNRRANINCTVLKVAHHGSVTSSSPAFLSVAQPQFAVISASADNTFGHPDPETIKRLQGVITYRTDISGTIEFTTDGEKLWVKTSR